MKMNWTRSVSIAILFLLATSVGMFCGMATAAPAGSQPVPAVAEKPGKGVSLSTADHSKFTILQQDFKTGPEVTKACLTCHTEASLQVHKTYHWTWESSGGVQKGLGKKNVLNNF